MPNLERIKKIVNWLIFEGFASSEKEIAEKIGYTKSSFSQIINGRVPMSDKFVNRLLKANENINKVWVLTGEGEMLKDLSQPKVDYMEKYIQSLEESIKLFKEELRLKNIQIEKLTHVLVNLSLTDDDSEEIETDMDDDES